MTARVRALAPAPTDLQRRQILLTGGLLTGVAVLGGLALPAEAPRDVVQQKPSQVWYICN